jgi:hypothetical protein
MAVSSVLNLNATVCFYYSGHLANALYPIKSISPLQRTCPELSVRSEADSSTFRQAQASIVQR